MIECIKKLAQEHLKARDSWRALGDESDICDSIDGVGVVLKYEGSNRCTDYRTVLLDGVHFAREIETIPWNLFKGITVSYTCFTALSEKSARELLKSLKLEDSTQLEEEYYPPEDRLPLFNVSCGDLRSVVKIWKAYRPVWTGDKKWGELPKKETE